MQATPYILSKKLPLHKPLTLHQNRQHPSLSFPSEFAKSLLNPWMRGEMNKVQVIRGTNPDRYFDQMQFDDIEYNQHHFSTYTQSLTLTYNQP